MSAVAPAEIVTTLPAVPSGGGLAAAIAAVMNEVNIVRNAARTNSTSTATPRWATS